jgi:hypothetical protein
LARRFELLGGVGALVSLARSSALLAFRFASASFVCFSLSPNLKLDVELGQRLCEECRAHGGCLRVCVCVCALFRG